MCFACRLFRGLVKHCISNAVSDLQVLSLLKMRKYSAGKGWTFPGLIAVAYEPYLVTTQTEVITLWERQGGTRVKAVTVQGGIVGVTVALNEWQRG